MRCNLEPANQAPQKCAVEMFPQAKHWPDAISCNQSTCGGHTAVEALRRSAPTHHSRGQGDSHFEPECRLGQTFYCPILHRCQQLGLERQGKGCVHSADLCMSDLNWLLLRCQQQQCSSGPGAAAASSTWSPYLSGGLIPRQRAEPWPWPARLSAALLMPAGRCGGS
jgi:hypothetical protein